MTLKALANVLNRSRQSAVTAADYFNVLRIYARSHRLILPEGRAVAFVDENLNPFTGETTREGDGQTQRATPKVKRQR